jgi:hypothetical protein
MPYHGAGSVRGPKMSIGWPRQRHLLEGSSRNPLIGPVQYTVDSARYLLVKRLVFPTRLRSSFSPGGNASATGGWTFAQSQQGPETRPVDRYHTTSWCNIDTARERGSQGCSSVNYSSYRTPDLGALPKAETAVPSNLTSL